MVSLTEARSPINVLLDKPSPAPASLHPAPSTQSRPLTTHVSHTPSTSPSTGRLHEARHQQPGPLSASRSQQATTLAGHQLSQQPDRPLSPCSSDAEAASCSPRSSCSDSSSCHTSAQAAAQPRKTGSRPDGVPLLQLPSTAQPLQMQTQEPLQPMLADAGPTRNSWPCPQPPAKADDSDASCLEPPAGSASNRSCQDSAVQEGSQFSSMPSTARAAESDTSSRAARFCPVGGSCSSTAAAQPRQGVPKPSPQQPQKLGGNMQQQQQQQHLPERLPHGAEQQHATLHQQQQQGSAAASVHCSACRGRCEASLESWRHEEQVCPAVQPALPDATPIGQPGAGFALCSPGCICMTHNPSAARLPGQPVRMACTRL